MRVHPLSFKDHPCPSDEGADKRTMCSRTKKRMMHTHTQKNAQCTQEKAHNAHTHRKSAQCTHKKAHDAHTHKKAHDAHTYKNGSTQAGLRAWVGSAHAPTGQTPTE